MYSGSPSFESSSHEASAPGTIRLCTFCRKPFLKETSYNRHILYCRRAKSRPRTRVRSCRACSAAKAKCSFQSPCLRCTNRGTECIYDNAPTAHRNPVTGEHAPALSSTTLTADDFTFNDLFPSGGTIDIDGAQVDMDWDALAFGASDISSQDVKTNMPRLSEPTTEVMSNGLFLLGNSDVDGVRVNFDTENFPSSALTIHNEYSTALAEPTRPYERPDSSGFLVRLPISDPISHFIATSVIQMIRTYPLMMLRRETLPSFIHGHWYIPSSATQLSLPEPLVNCMGIAQIFASHNTESKPFLWRTVNMERHSFIEKKNQRKFSKGDLLAAIQSQIMYIIMRIIDESKMEQDMNLEMLKAHESLCESLMNICNEPFCQDERRHPSSSWEDWVFAESRRRTALVWFLIAQTVHIKIGVPCDTISGYQDLPLCSPKSLWEAKTRSEWQAEYDTYRSMQRIGPDVFGDLIDACKQSDSGANRKLDTWNAQADNLGMLLSWSASMMAKDCGQ